MRTIFTLCRTSNTLPTMTLLRGICAIILKAILVTITVAFGFTLCGLLGLPSWLQMLGIIPAGYLMYRLSGETPPPIRQWLPFLLGLTLLLFLFSIILPRIPESWRVVAYFCFGILAPYLLRLFSLRTQSKVPELPSSETN